MARPTRKADRELQRFRVNSETTNVLTGNLNLSTTADAQQRLQVTYVIQISAGTLSAANYSFAFSNGILTVSSLPSMLTIQYISESPKMVILNATGLTPSSTYHVLGSTNCVDWPEIGTAQSDAGGSMSYTNNVTVPAQFYRIYGP